MKADDRIAYIKIYVDGRSAEIQKKLFELGAKWAVDYDQEIQETDKPFLFVNSFHEITYHTDKDYFTNKEHREVKADELLSWEVKKEEQKFEPYQKVLVRQGDGTVWFADLFAFRNSEYVCVGSHWEQCIPYEGNEHLLGTTEEPRKEGTKV